jgi:tetratricopeptide (TPR) repeat protein
VAQTASPHTSPEEWLRRAVIARDATSRARLARRGLATRAPLDPTTQTMLLRQLYLAAFESRKFARAREIAESAIDLRVMRDVIHHDAARAATAEGDVDAAVEHLRAAARRAPITRRAFHWWTLGSTLFFAQRYAEAITALERAVRWSTTDKPLYRGHLALVRIASGDAPASNELQKIIDDLAHAPGGQGYGRFVLGHLAYAAREFRVARKYLEAFVARTAAWAPATAIALEPELAMTTATLAKMTES